MNVLHELFSGISHTMLEVLVAFAPIVIIFLVLNAVSLRVRRQIFVKIMGGFVITYFGLVLFLQGVYAAFVPAGEHLGAALAAMEHNWILVPLGFLIGFLVAFAEPAVLVMVKQVEEMSSGAIKARYMLFAISVGVALAVMIAMLRLLYGFSLWAILIPGYVLVFILAHFADKQFVAMAFDNGGVATGPLCSTFVLSLSIAVATGIPGRDPLIDGFGIVALIAMAPILTTMVMSFIFKRKKRLNEEKAEGLES